jgi:hypothetical protein
MATDALAQKERELQLILAWITRDSLEDDGDPQSMFHSIANLLNPVQGRCSRRHVDRETSDDVETIVAVGLPEDMATDLCREAMKVEKPAR